jgi:hypothetical protein
VIAATPFVEASETSCRPVTAADAPEIVFSRRPSVAPLCRTAGTDRAPWRMTRNVRFGLVRAVASSFAGTYALGDA